MWYRHLSLLKVTTSILIALITRLNILIRVGGVLLVAKVIVLMVKFVALIMTQLMGDGVAQLMRSG